MCAPRKRGAKRETACEALRPSVIFREMSQDNTVTIHIGGKDPGEWLSDIHAAICQVKMLVFERRELDLREPECHALYVLTDLQERIVARN